MRDESTDAENVEVFVPPIHADKFSKLHFVSTEKNSMAQVRGYLMTRYKVSHLDHRLELGHRLTALMDTIDDTSEATSFYINSSFPDSTGGGYLLVYGLLAVLGMQFEAIDEFVRVLKKEQFIGTKMKLDPRFDRIKQTRNDVIHQMNRDYGQHFFRVMRRSVSKESIETRRDMGRYETVNIFTMVREQIEAVDSDLGRLLEGLAKSKGPVATP